MGDRAMLYPFRIDSAEIIKYRVMMHRYKEIYPVSLQGLAYDGVDVGILCKENPLGVTVSTDFEEVLKKCSDVILVACSESCMPNVHMAIKQQKIIVCTFSTKDGCMEDEIEKECNKKGVYFQNVVREGRRIEQRVDGISALTEVETPVILICGMSQDTQKFDIQLSLRKKLMERGYSVSQIGTKEYSSMFGFHPFPSFMLHPGDDEEKILRFNAYVRLIEEEEKPDVILLGIPDGALPFDHEYTNGFGILTFLVSHAVSVDYAIFSTPFMEYDKTYYRLLVKMLRYRYGFDKVAIHVSNIYHDLQSDERVGDKRLFRVSSNQIENVMKVFPTQKVGSVTLPATMDTLVDNIIAYLSS